MLGWAQLLRLARHGTPVAFLPRLLPVHASSHAHGEAGTRRLLWEARPSTNTIHPHTHIQDMRLFSTFHNTHAPSNTATHSTQEKVKSGLAELRMKLDRLGSLSLADMQQVVTSLELCAGQLSGVDCLALLKFCRKMVEEEHRPCGDVVQRVWDLTTQRQSGGGGGEVTSEHLELYLHLCLAVESVAVSEKAILKIMAQHKIQPDPRVFEALMMALGQRGQLGAALSVLATMKDKEIPVREATFAALVMAYGTARDWEAVQGVLDTMRSVQMTLSDITYSALATVCATLGHMDQLRQAVVQAREAGHPLSSGQLETALLALITSGHAGEGYKNIDTMLQMIDESGMKIDTSWVALRLIHSARVHEAVHLALSLPHLHTHTHLYSNGAVYITEMILAHTEPSLVLEVCQLFHQRAINDYSLEVALEAALKDGQEDIAWTLLKAMKESGRALREHYFWPLFHLKAIEQESAKLLESVSAMLGMGITPGLESLRDHIIPGLSLSQPSLTLRMLQNTGLSAAACATPLLLVLLRERMLGHAVQFVRQTKAPFHLGDILGTLAQAWHSSPKNVVALLALLIHKQEEVDDRDWGGQFLLYLVATRAGLALDQIRPLFQEMRGQRVGVSEHSADLLLSRLNSPVLREAVRDALPLVLSAELGHPPLEASNSILHPRHMSEDQLEGHLEELRAKGLNTRGSQRRLLLQRAARNDTEGVMELLKSSSQQGHRLSPGMLASALDAYISAGHTQTALDTYRHLRTEHRSFTLDSYKILDLCTLLTKEGRSPEAIDILLAYIADSPKKPNPRQIRRNSRELLMALASTRDLRNTQRVFDLLVEGGLVVPDTLSLGAMVKCQLNCGDLKGALEEMKKAQEKYRCLPMRREVLINIIDSVSRAADESQAVASRQLLTETLHLIAEVQGSSNAHLDLFFAYVESGRTSEAGKVLKGLGQQVNQGQISRQLNYYVKTQNEAAVLTLLAASRGHGAVDRLAAYSALLSIYYVQGEGHKGLALWTSLQEEGLTPAPSFLSSLAALLAACKIKIPFKL